MLPGHKQATPGQLQVSSVIGLVCSDQADACDLSRRCCGLPRRVHAGAKGWGLAAAAEIPAESLVMEYVGEVVSMGEAQRRAAAYARAGMPHTYMMSLRWAISCVCSRLLPEILFSVPAHCAPFDQNMTALGT